MNQNVEKNTQMSFKDYYDYLKSTQTELRDLICAELGISRESFYVKLRHDSWRVPERKEIDRIMYEHIQSLPG